MVRVELVKVLVEGERVRRHHQRVAGARERGEAEPLLLGGELLSLELLLVGRLFALLLGHLGRRLLRLLLGERGLEHRPLPGRVRVPEARLERLAAGLRVEAHRELHGTHPPDKVHVRPEERGAEQLHDALPRRQREDEGGGREQQREPPCRERVAPLEEAAERAEGLQRLSEPLLLWREVGGEHSLDRVEVLLAAERCEHAASRRARSRHER
mmetsp:Transcript_30689/g.96421  ORF Transcript_30689/g.96421 Transcript_30689/m.96421 type:complete len:213 (+) Transcript_30689:202-840(+)